MRSPEPDVTLVRFVPFITGCELMSELYGNLEATLVHNLHVALPPRMQRCTEHFRIGCCAGRSAAEQPYRPLRRSSTTQLDFEAAARATLALAAF